jgi:hypothetical protein
MKKKQKEQKLGWQNGGRRIVGLGLILTSIAGIVYFNSMDWNNTFFYLTGGWGLGMLP